MEGVTRESIKPLLELQRIDSAIDRLRARRADLPEQRELDGFLDQRAAIDTPLTERVGALEEVIRDQTRLEGEIELLDQRRVSEERRMGSGEVQNPRELQNIQAELDAVARRKSHLEDQELEVMERREELEKEADGFRAQIAELDGSIADTTARRDAVTVEIDKELGELGARRDGIVPGLPAELVAFYDELRQKYGGIAVGAYEDGTCRACSLPLSPMAKDDIRRSDEALLRCENCRRLLIEP